MRIDEFIEQRLESTGITLEEFRGLLIRLVNYGVLERGESQTEQELYDRFVRVEELVGEALSAVRHRGASRSAFRVRAIVSAGQPDAGHGAGRGRGL